MPTINLGRVSGTDGKNGLSAYDAAVAGGYEGSEAEFYSMLSGFYHHASRHASDGDDPITPEMIGAKPATDSDVFIAEYGVTKNSEIEEAFQAGKAVFVFDGCYFAALSDWEGDTEHIFSNSYTRMQCVNDVWSYGEDSFNPTKHAGTHKSNGSDPITPAMIGASESGHTHAAGDINSGTLSTSRLPTVPVSKGGTGKTTLTSGSYLVGAGTSAVTLKTPEQVRADIQAARIQLGSYVGTGTYGPNNPNSLTFDFEPKIVILFGANTAAYLNADASATSALLLWGVKTTLAVNGTSSVYFNTVEYSGNTMSWYASAQTGNESIQLNASGVTYYYAAIG